jgi:VCBS repeat-containing protein
VNQGGDVILEVEHGLIEAVEVLNQDAFNQAALILTSPDISTETGDTATAEVGLMGQFGILDVSGINPNTGNTWAVGDTYRLVFVSSTTIPPTSTDIATYNTLIQDAADAAGYGSATWNAIVSTETVNARVNTNTESSDTDGAFFLMNGTKEIAGDIADFWDNDHSTSESINFDESNIAAANLPGSVPFSSFAPVWTGTSGNGTTNRALGTSNVSFGIASSAASKGQWTSRGSSTDLTDEMHLYGMSQVLTVQEPLSATGTLTLTDIDTANTVSAAVSTVVESGTISGIDNSTLLAMMSVTSGDILDNTETSNTFNWTFNSNSETFNYLAAGETLTLTYTISATDDTLESDSQTVLITVTGSNDAPDISIETGDLAVGSLAEDSTTPITDTLTIADVNLTDIVTASVSSTVGLSGNASANSANPIEADLFNMFAISPSAILSGSQTSESLTWTFTPVAGAFDHLAGGETLILTYTISATDDASPAEPDTQSVVITITGSNDAPDISVETGDLAVGSLAEDSTTPITDTLTVGDVDLTDVVTASVSSTVGLSGNASANSDNPIEADLFNMFAISPSAILSGSQTSESLTWTFTPVAGAFDHLAGGETLILTYTISATDDAAGTGTQTVLITITGSNDVPDISVETGDLAVGSLAEDSTTPITATLTVGDVDLTDVVTASVSSTVGLSGSASANSDNPSQTDFFNMFAISPSAILSGSQTSESLTWTFTPAAGAFDHLAGGETLILTYTINATDDAAGTDTQTVLITITGNNNTPVISIETGDSVNAVITETTTTLSATDTLTITDLDTTNTVTIDVTTLVESGTTSGILNSTLLGMMTVTSADILDNTETTNVFDWSFDSGIETFSYLNNDQTLTLTYTITATDSQGNSSTQFISVKVNGLGTTFVVPVEVQRDISFEELKTTITNNIVREPTILQPTRIELYTSHSSMAFNQRTLANDSLIKIPNITGIQPNNEIEEDDSDGAEGIKTLNVYDIFLLPIEESTLIDKLPASELDPTEDLEKEKSETDFNAGDAAQKELSLLNKVDKRLTQYQLDNREDLQDSLIMGYNIFDDVG